MVFPTVLVALICCFFLWQNSESCAPLKSAHSELTEILFQVNDFKSVHIALSGAHVSCIFIVFMMLFLLADLGWHYAGPA